MNRLRGILGVLAVVLLPTAAAAQATGSTIAGAVKDAPEGWQTVSPREEIRPQFSFEPASGPQRAGSLVIAADARDGGTEVTLVGSMPIAGW